MFWSSLWKWHFVERSSQNILTHLSTSSELILVCVQVQIYYQTHIWTKSFLFPGHWNWDWKTDMMETPEVLKICQSIIMVPIFFFFLNFLKNRKLLKNISIFNWQSVYPYLHTCIFLLLLFIFHLIKHSINGYFGVESFVINLLVEHLLHSLGKTSSLQPL